MRNQNAWRLICALALMLLIVGGVGLHRTYHLELMLLDGYGTVCYGQIQYKTYPGVTHYVELVFVSVLWTRRYR